MHSLSNEELLRMFSKIRATKFTLFICFQKFLIIVDFQEKAVNTTNLVVPDSEQEHG